MALLDQGSDPLDLPHPAASSQSDWIRPLAEQLYTLVSNTTGSVAFIGDGHTYLLAGEPETVNDGIAAYVRLPGTGRATPHALATTMAVLVLSGGLDLAVYRRQQDIDDGTPHYVRTYGPCSVFACHQGTLCLLQSAPNGIQVVVTRGRPPLAGRRAPLPLCEVQETARRAHTEIVKVLHSLTQAPVGGA
ncbi:hypothetical protein [Streptomyces xanthochromogenes]|uniref:hypothetical protein n=1 Tax=Streptomyces xanthochromogenes TaxID=67384 RepID=UPI001678BB04|nr:hypothetical protein [Streptomyces xanthochromogenes]